MLKFSPLNLYFFLYELHKFYLYLLFRIYLKKLYLQIHTSHNYKKFNYINTKSEVSLYFECIHQTRNKEYHLFQWDICKISVFTLGSYILNLYPAPHTVSIYSGLLLSNSIFSLILLICTVTVELSPTDSSPQILSSSLSLEKTIL